MNWGAEWDVASMQEQLFRSLHSTFEPYERSIINLFTDPADKVYVSQFGNIRYAVFIRYILKKSSYSLPFYHPFHGYPHIKPE